MGGLNIWLKMTGEYVGELEDTSIEVIWKVKSTYKKISSNLINICVSGVLEREERENMAEKYLKKKAVNFPKC